MTDETPPLIPEHVTAAFQQLKTAATQLNTVSDELGKAITSMDRALQQLNLGISSWVKVTSWHDDDDSYSVEEIGYNKIGTKWGIGLRTRWGNNQYPEGEQREEWLFNEAPRRLRVAAVAKLPDLLMGLTTEAFQTAERIKEQIATAQAVVTAVAAVKK